MVQHSFVLASFPFYSPIRGRIPRWKEVSSSFQARAWINTPGGSSISMRILPRSFCPWLRLGKRRRRRRLENTETREARIIACWHLRKLSIGARGKRARVLKNNAATVTNNFYTDVPIEIQIPASRSVFQPALSKPLRRGDNSRVRRNEATLHARIYRRAKHLFRRLENVFTTNTRYGTRRASQTRRNVSLVSKTRGENPTTKSVNFSTFYYNHKNHVWKEVERQF